MRRFLRRSLWCFPHSSLPVMDLVRRRPCSRAQEQGTVGQHHLPEWGSKGLAGGINKPLPSAETHTQEAIKEILSLHDPLDRYWQNTPVSSLGNSEYRCCPPSKPWLTAIWPVCFGLWLSPFLAKWFYASLRLLSNPLCNHGLLQTEIQSRTLGTGHLHRFQAREIGGWG